MINFVAMKELKFSSNWNNKLGNDYFTTIRLFSSKWNKGDIALVTMDNKELFQAEVLDVKTIRAGDMDSFMCYQDAGMSPDKLKNMLKTMYKIDDESFPKVFFLYILLKKSESPKLF